jgi:hypothetical protein
MSLIIAPSAGSLFTFPASGNLVVVPANAAPTDPTGGAVTGIAWWLRASLGVSAVSGAWLWKDQSGHSPANDVADQGYAPMDPTLLAAPAGFGGQPAIDFGDGSSFLGLATTFGAGFLGVPQPLTAYCVCRFHNFGGTPVVMDSVNNGGNRCFLFSNGGSWFAFAGSFISGGTPDTNVHIFGMVFNGASSAIYVDSSSGTPITGDAGTNNLGGSVIGDQYCIGGLAQAANPAVYANVSSHAIIGDWAVYAGAHNAATVHKVFVAEAANYGASWS